MTTEDAGASAPSTAPETEKPFAVPSVLPDSRPETPHLATSTIVRICLVIVGIGTLLYAIYRVLPVLLLLFIAIMLATAIEPLVNNLRRGPFSRSQGILIVYTGIFAVLVAIGWLIIPVFINQVGEVVTNLPKSATAFHDWASHVSNPFLRDQALQAATALQSILPATGTGATAGGPPNSQAANGADVQAQVASVSAAALGLAEGFLSVIVVFVIAFYWMTERTHIKRWVVVLLPADRGNRIRHVWDDIELKVGGWVRGQLTLMALVGLISAVGYFVIGVRYWPALALFIALAEAVPMVGPYIGTAPAILVALVQPENDGLLNLLGLAPLDGLTRAILVVVFAVVLQTVEGNILVPRVMRNSVGISPLTVIVSLLVGSALAGLPGAVLAVPLAASLQVIVTDQQAAAQAKAKKELHAATEEAEKAAAAAKAGEDAAPEGGATTIIRPGTSTPGA